MATETIDTPLEPSTLPWNHYQQKLDSDVSGGVAGVDNLGAFRGLAYAIVFQLVFVVMVATGWEVWRLLR